MSWQPGDFDIAMYDMTSTRTGYVYRGLGLHQVSKASPKGRRPPQWKLTHLGSGHCVCIIGGLVADAFPIATEIAECADWSFDGLNGWRNMDPDLPQKLSNLLAKYPKRCRRATGGTRNEEVARRIAMARLDSTLTTAERLQEE